MYDVYKMVDLFAAQGYIDDNLAIIENVVMINDEEDVEAERLAKFMKMR